MLWTEKALLLYLVNVPHFFSTPVSSIFLPSSGACIHKEWRFQNN